MQHFKTIKGLIRVFLMKFNLNLLFINKYLLF